MLRVKEVSDLAGISVRTLHHYDAIGLLRPGHTTAAGYRLYTDADLELLQQILFFRELDFPLRKIREIVTSRSYDRREALELHRNLLLERRTRIDSMLATLEKTIRHMQGEIKMTNKEKFEGFDFSRNPYEREARERWGDATVDASNAKLAKLSDEEKKAMGDEMNAIYRRLAELRHGAPDAPEAQEAIGQWYRYLARFGTYSLEAFRNLGQMYVDDERFTKNIDAFGDGLARFMRDAMAAYAG